MWQTKVSFEPWPDCLPRAVGRGVEALLSRGGVNWSQPPLSLHTESDYKLDFVLVEGGRRLQNQDRGRVLRMISFHNHRDPKAFLPCALDQNLDVPLAAPESPMAFVSL